MTKQKIPDFRSLEQTAHTRQIPSRIRGHLRFGCDDGGGGGGGGVGRRGVGGRVVGGALVGAPVGGAAGGVFAGGFGSTSEVRSLVFAIPSRLRIPIARIRRVAACRSGTASFTNKLLEGVGRVGRGPVIAAVV